MKFYQKAQDPISFLTHFLGVILGAFYLIYVLVFVKDAPPLTITGLVIFAISTILLYGASSTYHYISDDAPYKKIFRKIDHSMIYFLIAGSYAPVCFAYLPQDKGLLFVGVLFLIAIIGTLGKIFWLNAPRMFYTLLYLVMGWAVIFDLGAFSNVPFELLMVLLAGGISYSIGAIIYIIKKPNFKHFNFHDIFHIFILFGTIIQGFGYLFIIL